MCEEEEEEKLLGKRGGERESAWKRVCAKIEVCERCVLPSRKVRAGKQTEVISEIGEERLETERPRRDRERKRAVCSHALSYFFPLLQDIKISHQTRQMHPCLERERLGPFPLHIILSLPPPTLSLLSELRYESGIPPHPSIHLGRWTVQR